MRCLSFEPLVKFSSFAMEAYMYLTLSSRFARPEIPLRVGRNNSKTKAESESVQLSYCSRAPGRILALMIAAAFLTAAPIAKGQLYTGSIEFAPLGIVGLQSVVAGQAVGYGLPYSLSPN